MNEVSTFSYLVIQSSPADAAESSFAFGMLSIVFVAFFFWQLIAHLEFLFDTRILLSFHFASNHSNLSVFFFCVRNHEKVMGLIFDNRFQSSMWYNTKSVYTAVYTRVLRVFKKTVSTNSFSKICIII